MSQVAAEKLHAEKLQVSDDDGVYAPWPDGVDIEVRTTKQRTWARSVMSCGCGTCRVAFVARYVPCLSVLSVCVSCVSVTLCPACLSGPSQVTSPRLFGAELAPRHAIVQFFTVSRPPPRIPRLPPPLLRGCGSTCVRSLDFPSLDESGGV